MKYQVYVDAAGEWRWRLLASNGNNLGNSGEGYKNLTDIREVISKIVKPGIVVEIAERNANTFLVEDK